MSQRPASVRRTAAVCGLLGALALVGVARAPQAGAAVTCGPPAAGMASVAVVVDTGSGDPLVRCVTVREGATGRDALSAAGLPFRVGTGTPADNNQGGAFLCGILGVPQSGCATPSSKGVSYWAYYRQGSGSPWTYSRVGFFTPVASRCAVEGWRWTTAGGVAAADNPRPRVAPPLVSCPGAAPAPTAPSTTALVPRVPATTAAPRPAAPSATAPAAPTTSAPVTSASTVPAAEVAGRTTVVPAPAGPAASPTSTTTPVVGRDAAQGPAEQAVGSSRSSSSGGVPWAVVGALLVAAVIGAGALVRSRRAG